MSDNQVKVKNKKEAIEFIKKNEKEISRRSSILAKKYILKNEVKK